MRFEARARGSGRKRLWVYALAILVVIVLAGGYEYYATLPGGVVSVAVNVTSARVSPSSNATMSLVISTVSTRPVLVTNITIRLPSGFGLIFPAPLGNAKQAICFQNMTYTCNPIGSTYPLAPAGTPVSYIFSAFRLPVNSGSPVSMEFGLVYLHSLSPTGHEDVSFYVNGIQATATVISVGG